MSVDAAEPTPVTSMPTLDGEPVAATAPAATGAVVHLPAINGGDPLVAAYAQRFRATCAMRTFSWGWLALGVVTVLAGGLVLSALLGPEFALDQDRSALAHLANRLLGNPWGALAGMTIAAFITSTLGVVLNRDAVPCGQEPWFGFLIAVALYLPLYDPLIALGVLGGALTLVYVAAIAFRLLALAMGGRRGLRHEVLEEPAGGWPLYTVLVPLYKERNVARNILVALERLSYPRDRLDVKFLLEADDPETLHALTAAGVPPWAEVVVVPPGQPKTKPRACNHGLARARGEFLVIFDAEDRPEADQLKQAVLAFRDSEEHIVCLQAQLAYHNHRQNLLTRWFALEYNVWFRRYLDGLVALGVPIPLGGTSNHFRTRILRDIGGWDPFNVTEDCDLGVRLYMAGHHTRTLDSTTWEEANSRLGNWIRQRSRWLKGYLITHLVWGRRPWLLVARLNPWGALGFVLSVFCVSILSALNLALWVVSGIYATLLAMDLSRGYGLWELLSTRDQTMDRWSWPMIFHGRYEDPGLAILSQVFFAASLALIAGNVAFILMNFLAGRRPGQRGLLFAALISPLYWVLLAIAAWKGMWQLIWRPHYWEKTVHGLDEGHGPSG
jgi:cellulose synthase/poly-beta-1,6-N-acetylglucosamine synthase-like glycosyltransferase